MNQLRKTGSKWYYYNEFGKQDTPVMGLYRQVRLPEYMENEWVLALIDLDHSGLIQKGQSAIN